MSVKTLGGYIRRLRIARGLRQKDLGELAGLTQGMISHIEIGRHRPTLDTLIRIAHALSVPPGELLQAFERENEEAKRRGFAGRQMLYLEAWFSESRTRVRVKRTTNPKEAPPGASTPEASPPPEGGRVSTPNAPAPKAGGKRQDELLKIIARDLLDRRLKAIARDFFDCLLGQTKGDKQKGKESPGWPFPEWDAVTNAANVSKSRGPGSSDYEPRGAPRGGRGPDRGFYAPGFRASYPLRRPV